MIKRLGNAGPKRKRVWDQRTAIEIEVGILCDQAGEMWPDVFMASIESPEHSEPCWAIGLVDNHEKKLVPTEQQVQQLRDCLKLGSDEIPLKWYPEPYPSERF